VPCRRLKENAAACYGLAETASIDLAQNRSLHARLIS
jgi:hypothetical protein